MCIYTLYPIYPIYPIFKIYIYNNNNNKNTYISYSYVDLDSLCELLAGPRAVSPGLPLLSTAQLQLRGAALGPGGPGERPRRPALQRPRGGRQGAEGLEQGHGGAQWAARRGGAAEGLQRAQGRGEEDGRGDEGSAGDASEVREEQRDFNQFQSISINFNQFRWISMDVPLDLP